MSQDDVTGLVGRVSVSIGPDLPGAVIIFIRGGTSEYAAYSSGGEVIPKNTQAVVIEQTGPSSVMVTATGA